MNEENKESTQDDNINWDKSHPLSKNQNRILGIIFFIILLVLLIFALSGFKEMFDAQAIQSN